jgi:hypothetical protein
VLSIGREHHDIWYIQVAGVVDDSNQATTTLRKAVDNNSNNNNSEYIRIPTSLETDIRICATSTMKPTQDPYFQDTANLRKVV